MQINGVKVSKFVEDFGLEVLHKGNDFDTAKLTIQDVNRPGLPLSGFFEHFDTERLLLIGLTER